MSKIKHVVKSIIPNILLCYLVPFYKDKIKNRNIAKQRRKNHIYYNRHKGERCFILGNGPSLRDVNLKLLENEFVFTVNNFSMIKSYKDVKTNVHLWMDNSFFELRNDQKYDRALLIENYHKIGKEKAICFFPDVAEPFLKRNSLDKILDINYLSTYEIVANSQKLRTDITKHITGYTTVVQYAIVIAMYMGFSEIYLLGCDSTNIVSLLNCAMKKTNTSMHAYDNDDVNERYEGLLKAWTMTDVFFDQYTLFLGYKRLKEECDKRNISLVNCSGSTLINEIPRTNLSEILN